MNANDLRLIGGVIAAMLAMYMLTHDVSTRIRNSRFWFVGWSVYIILLSLAGKLLIPFYDKLGIKDEVVVPVLLGTLFVVTFGAYFIAMYRLRRQARIPESLRE